MVDEIGHFMNKHRERCLRYECVRSSMSRVDGICDISVYTQHFRVCIDWEPAGRTVRLNASRAAATNPRGEAGQAKSVCERDKRAQCPISLFAAQEPVRTRETSRRSRLATSLVTKHTRKRIHRAAVVFALAVSTKLREQRVNKSESRHQQGGCEDQGPRHSGSGSAELTCCDYRDSSIRFPAIP